MSCIATSRQSTTLKKFSPEGEGGTETKTQRDKKKEKAKKGKRIAELEKMDAWQQLRLFQGRKDEYDGMGQITHVGTTAEFIHFLWAS